MNSLTTFQRECEYLQHTQDTNLVHRCPDYHMNRNQIQTCTQTNHITQLLSRFVVSQCVCVCVIVVVAGVLPLCVPFVT